jgi:hypothetical protein
MKNDIIGFALAMLATVLVIHVLLFAYIQPRLIGYGCEGAVGPLFAAEEGHFPVCKEIKPIV